MGNNSNAIIYGYRSLGLCSDKSKGPNDPGLCRVCAQDTNIQENFVITSSYP